MKKILNIMIATLTVAIVLFTAGCDNESDPPIDPLPTDSSVTDPSVADTSVDDPQINVPTTPSVKITIEKVSGLPGEYWQAYLNVSPVGGNPRFTNFSNQMTTFYAYDKFTHTYYKGILTLPEGYKNGKIVTGMSGAGSGEIYMVLRAEKDGAEHYIQYDLTGLYPEFPEAFEAFLYIADGSNQGDNFFIERIEKQIEQHKADEIERRDYPSLETEQYGITYHKLERLPFIPEYALSDVSPIGTYPRYIINNFGLTYYYYNWQYDAIYECSLYLPPCFTDGKIIHTTRGAGSGEVDFYVLAQYRNGCWYHIRYSFYGWDEEPQTPYTTVINRFDEDGAQALLDLKISMGNYEIEQHKMLIELGNNPVPSRGGQLYPYATKSMVLPEGEALVELSSVRVLDRGMIYYRVSPGTDVVSKCALPLPERFINGEIVHGTEDEDGNVRLYILADHLGTPYYIEYQLNGNLAEPAEFTVLNGEDPSDWEKIGQILEAQQEYGTLALDLAEFEAQYYHLGDLAKEIQEHPDKYRYINRITLDDCEIKVIYDEYGQLCITSVTAFGHTVTLDQPWVMYGNRLTGFFEADAGQPVYVFEIGTSTYNWWIFTEEGIAREPQSLPEVAEYNRIDTYLYKGDDGKLLYMLTPWKYLQVQAFQELLEYAVAVDEFAKEEGYITVENCQTLYHPTAQYTIEEVHQIRKGFAEWKENVNEYYDKDIIEKIGMFAKAETVEEYLAYNAQRYERAYSPNGELPR